MKQDQNLRFVIIGMGYLMEYIAPCYSKLLGDKKAEQMLGVTAEPQAVQTKAKATGIPVILNDNAGALRRMEPDIILFAPPPSLAAPLTESVLVPYFAECRAAGKELPMLFAFPPKPEGKYYQEQLGHDCKVVNILPNMISEICGRTCAEAGFTMVTLPESHTWQPEELDFIRRFWQPLGQVVFLTPAEVQVALAVSCSNQMLSEIFLDMQTALPEAYHESASALAEAARAYLMEKLGYQPPQPVESSVQAVPPAMLEAVKKVTYHAHRGTLKFMLEKGFDADKAETIQRMNYDLNLRKVQLMPREELRRATRHHATRGGVLERACISYTQNWQDSVCSHFAKYPDWTPDAQWAEALEDGFVQMSQDVFDHLSQLAKKKEESVCDIEQHAVLYALLEKEAVEQAGEAGRAAMTEATAQYGLERGRRMRAHALEHGDEVNSFTYLAYGEWSPKPGQMEVGEVPEIELYTTHVTKCEWCRCWNKHNLMEYGKAYCQNVDKCIAHGYDPDFDLGVNSLMSAGDAVCEFGYGFIMTPELREKLAEIRQRIGTSAQKGFNYHTAHLWVTCRRVLCEQLGETAGNDIADDEQIARETMRDYLPWAEMGMQTPICVENGALALDHLCHDKIDIFIMDIRMPIMDGMALLEEITRRNIDVLIIVLSAYDQFEYAQKAISSRKVFEYVLKPIRRGNFCTLLQKAAAAVRSKRAESSPDSQALYDEVRKNYNGFLMQGHTAEGIALVRQKLEALPEPWSDWEGKKRFLIALYTDTQLEAVKQSTKNGQPACLPMNGLVQFEASHTDAELWQTFVSTVEELQPYLQPATAEASKASAVIEHTTIAKATTIFPL